MMSHNGIWISTADKSSRTCQRFFQEKGRIAQRPKRILDEKQLEPFFQLMETFKINNGIGTAPQSNIFLLTFGVLYMARITNFLKIRMNILMSHQI